MSAGPYDFPSPRAIAVNPADQIVVAGSFSGTIPLDDTSAITAVDSYDAFIARYDALGNLTWDSQAGGPGSDTVTGVAVDSSGGTIITGTFASSMQWGTTPALTAAGTYDLFLVKFQGNTALWSKSFGDGAGQQFGAIVRAAKTGSGDVVLAATTTGNVTFDGSTPMTSAGGKDVSLVRFDSNGAFKWGRAFGDAADQSANAAWLDPNGDAFVVGTVAGTVNVGTGDLPSAGANDALVARFAP